MYNRLCTMTTDTEPQDVPASVRLSGNGARAVDGKGAQRSGDQKVSAGRDVLENIRSRSGTGGAPRHRDGR